MDNFNEDPQIPDFQLAFESLSETGLDTTFGSGPQSALGDLTKLVHEGGIVDHSWLESPFTFISEYSIFPVQKDLEDEWLQGDTLYGAFKLHNNTEPIMSQIKRKSLWDHTEYTKDNLYPWAPPSSGRLPVKKSSLNVSQFYKRLLHRGYTGDNFAIEAQKYMDPETWNKTSSIREEILTKHEGLLGNVYVDATAFDTCDSANKFSSKFNKTAKFVLDTGACSGCKFNEHGRCAMIKKRITTEDLFTNKVSSSYLEYLKTVERIDDTFIGSVASLPNKEKVRKAFLNKRVAVKRVGGVKASLAPTANKKAKSDDPFIRIASKYISKGLDVDTLRSKFSTKVDGHRFESILRHAVKDLPVIPANIDECDSETLKLANTLKRANKCQGCVNDMGTHCRVAGTPFDVNSRSPIAPREGGFKADPAPRARTSNRSVTSFIPKVAKAIREGATYESLLAASEGKVTQPEFNQIVSEAMLQAKVASPDQFASCDHPTFTLTAQIRMGSRCGGCLYNEKSRCGKLKKAFSNPLSSVRVESAEITSEHNLYSSFYKDLDVTQCLELTRDNRQDSLEITGLGEFDI